MTHDEKVPDGVHDHDLEPPGLGGTGDPYYLPDIDDADEEKELPFCSSEQGEEVDV